MAERKSRSYKCTDKEYSAAMKRAKKLKFPLSNLIEMIIVGFGKGLDVKFIGGIEESATVTLTPNSISKPIK